MESKYSYRFPFDHGIVEVFVVADGLGIAGVILQHPHDVLHRDLSVTFLDQRSDPLQTNIGAAHVVDIVLQVHFGADIMIRMQQNAVLRNHGFNGLGIHFKSDGHAVLVGRDEVCHRNGRMASANVCIAEGFGFQHGPHTRA